MSTWSGDLVTHSGFRFHVRPVQPTDEPALALFFEHVTPEDLRFRFLSTVRTVGHDQLAAMINVDHRRTETFIASQAEGGPIIAAAMLACDDKIEVGEVAISVSADHKNLGVGWELLRHVSAFAEAAGVKRLQSVESRANRSAIQLEAEMGFKARDYQGDSTLVILEKTLSA